MIKLKDGSATELAQLDRLEQFDEKSKNFRIGDVHTATKPLRSYTWRCDQWYDQGREGACVAYSLGHEASSRPAEVTHLTDPFLKQQVYWEAQKIDPWPGGEYPGATPNYGGTSVLAGIKVLYKKLFFKEYRWAMDFRELLVGIGYNGPAVLGVPWYEGMYRPNADGYIKPTGRVMGGHAILARAINVKTKTVTLRNSWGKGWGHTGDCYISFDDLETVVRDRADMAFMLKRNTNPLEDLTKA